MTIRHVVCMRFSPDAPAEGPQGIVDALRELPALIPEIAAYHVGLDVGVNPPSWDLAVSADFADVDGYVAYRDHPEHQQRIRDLIDPIVAERVSVQFEL